MVEIKHTPGPWEVIKSKSKPAYNVIGTVLGAKFKIARCPITEYNQESLNKKEDVEVIANANLISAAPDLLEACLMVQEAERQAAIGFDHPDYEDFTEAFEKAFKKVNTAVKKATNQKEETHHA